MRGTLRLRPFRNKKEQATLRLLLNDWLYGQASISKSYRMYIARSKESVTIMASYFLPGKRIRRQLKKAAKRGVKIRVILSHTSDVQTVHKATHYLYKWMFKNNIEVYEYQPGVVHAKVMVIDNIWCTIGS